MLTIFIFKIYKTIDQFCTILNSKVKDWMGGEN